MWTSPNVFYDISFFLFLRLNLAAGFPHVFLGSFPIGFLEAMTI